MLLTSKIFKQYNIQRYISGIGTLVCLLYIYSASQTRDLQMVITNQPEGWFIASVELCRSCNVEFAEGDIVTQVGNISFEQRETFPLFTNFDDGEIVSLSIINRDGERKTIEYEVPASPGFDLARVGLLMLIVSPFIFASIYTTHFKMGNRATLFVMVAMGYAVWLSAGLIPTPLPRLNALLWLIIPAIWAFHWNMPKAIRPLPQAFWWIGYGVAIFIALLDIIGLLPYETFMLSILLQIVPTVGFALAQAISTRHRQAQLLLSGLVVAFLPALTWVISYSFVTSLTSPVFIYISVLSLMLLPLVYSYALTYDKLGHIEKGFRTILSATTYFIIVFSLTGMVVAIAGQARSWPSAQTNTVTVLFASLVCATYPLSTRYKGFVEARILGHLQGISVAQNTLGTRIMLDTDRLLDMVKQIGQDLSIKRSAIYLKQKGGWSPVMTDGMGLVELPATDSDVQASLDTIDGGGLSIPLIFSDKKIKGYWILGSKPTGDFYSEDETHVLTRLANQISALLEAVQIHKTLKESMEEREREAKLSSLGRLAAHIAHEINTPIGTILLNLENELVDGERHQGETKVRLTTIHKELLRTINIIDDIRSFSRTTGQASHVNVGTVIKEAMFLSERTLKMTEVNTSLDIQSNLPNVMMSWSKASRIFTNLITNACEAMVDGGNLSIRACSDNGWVTIKIKDSGIGIKDGDLPHLFEDGYTTKQNNSGLGLTICLSIVESVGGKLSIKSGRTSTEVTVSLPSA